MLLDGGTADEGVVAGAAAGVAWLVLAAAAGGGLPAPVTSLVATAAAAVVAITPGLGLGPAPVVAAAALVLALVVPSSTFGSAPPVFATLNMSPTCTRKNDSMTGSSRDSSATRADCGRTARPVALPSTPREDSEVQGVWREEERGCIS